jgi:uncharacterized tellurite resistance protein B-like protein
MKQFTTTEKYAIVTILSQIMNADGIIHPKEEEYMDKVYAELGIMIRDMEDITNIDAIQAKSVINAMPDEKKQFAQSLFVSMAKVDGYIHPLETEIINKLWMD